MNLKDNSVLDDGLNVVRGALMGGADAIPGVSGGTVALILQIYTRLVTAISHVDFRLLGYVRRRQWGEAARHVDLRFLLSLGCGIALGLAVTLLSIDRMLSSTQTRPLTLAAFFGMILASCFLVAKHIRAATVSNVAGSLGLASLGASAAFAVYWFTTFGRGVSLTGEPSYLYVFSCGAIAICAMILPGISGAMMLLLLGLYSYVASSVKHVLHGEDVGHWLATIVVFGAGCAIGLVLFSKLLRQLLQRFPSRTMAVLCGFMVGALPKLWPFDVKVTVQVESLPQYRPVLPNGLDGQCVGVLLVTLAGAALVLLIDWLARRRAGRSPSGGGKPSGCQEAVGPIGD